MQCETPSRSSTLRALLVLPWVLISTACTTTTAPVQETSALREPPAEVQGARVRDLGVEIGTLPPGPNNAITDVAGVAVGHATVDSGEDARTGVTLIVPRQGENTFQRKLACAVHTANGFGKAAGFTQVEELGTLEAPIALTNTLAVGTVLDALVRRVLREPGNEDVRSVNVVVGETNDGYLNDIRAFHVTRAHVDAAWDAAQRPEARGAVREGCVGAGTGTRCFAWKGGIGTASRVVGGWTVGVLVQSNFGGALRIDGHAVAELELEEGQEDGSCMMVIATDAPLDARQLGRLARRAPLGLARTGSVLSHGSGDYAIAFGVSDRKELLEDRELTPLFQAVVEATEEAVLNSLVAARTTRGQGGRVVPALPHALVRAAAQR